jgi:hypothetical protein
MVWIPRVEAARTQGSSVHQTIPKSDASYRATTTSEDDVKAAPEARTTAKDPTLSEVLRG